jgi:CRP/FNR family cyclic AMP-dependent transcriptional regulator
MQHEAKSEKLEALFRSGKQFKYKKNATIIRAGETPRGVHLIEDGLVKIYTLSRQGDEHVHHFFGPGDFFPIIWLFRQGVRNMFYETLCPTTTWLIDGEVFRNFVTANPDVTYQLLEEMVNRYYLFTGRIDNLLYSDALERSAHRLLSMVNRFGVKTKQGIVIDVSITHEDLAHSISTTRETFGRSMSRLQQKGIIGYDDQHHIVITDLPALSRIIGAHESETMWPELKRFTGSTGHRI